MRAGEPSIEGCGGWEEWMEAERGKQCASKAKNRDIACQSRGGNKNEGSSFIDCHRLFYTALPPDRRTKTIAIRA
jgi:hypothetical protein